MHCPVVGMLLLACYGSSIAWARQSPSSCPTPVGRESCCICAGATSDLSHVLDTSDLPQDNWGLLLNQTHYFYRTQWVGALPLGYDVPYRNDAFTHEVGPTRLDWGDISGGIMEGGNAGSLKITPTIAWSTAILAWGMLEFGEGYNNSNSWAAGMQTLKWNADYLLKTFKPDAASSAISEAMEFFIVYQVGNETREKHSWLRPEDETAPRLAYYTSTYNGTSDLAGQLAAALASTALVFQASDPTYSALLTSSAKALYGAGARNRATYTYAFNNPIPPQNSSPQVYQSYADDVSGLSPDDLFLGAVFGTYNSTSYLDDLTWAAAWLFKATGDAAYLNHAYRWWHAHTNSAEASFDDMYISDWNQVIYPAAVLLANLTNDATFHLAVRDYLRTWLCGVGGTILYTLMDQPTTPTMGLLHKQ